MAKYSTILTNELTGEQAVITSNDKYTFNAKVAKKRESWAAQNYRLLSVSDAQQKTKQAQAEIQEYKDILKSTLDVDDKLNWDLLVDSSTYTVPAPKLEDFYVEQIATKVFSFISSVKAKTERSRAEAEQKLQQALERYDNEKAAFYATQKEHNESLKARQQSYESHEISGVIDYFNLVLEKSKYPTSLNLNYELAYEPNGKVLLVEVGLPNKEALPQTVEFTYSPSKQEVLSKEMKVKEFEEYYNDVLFQIALRTIHEIYESDYSNAVDLVVLNGMVSGYDSKTGKDFDNCVLTVQASRNDFLEINLARVAPRDCFRYLKGITAGSLVNLAPVRPLMKLNTSDNRIIQADSVLDAMSENDNLAVMRWEDFEVLIRDLIQHEFGQDGSKVEVTRASRDAGVDAIAFDEDPIRGGKYVIQAKRYNNLVPVSAVRDLYGTVMNEGAVKGILVTTSYYGPDALEFVKGKPLTLINGEQLLYLFNKHGYKVKIELQKKQAAASEKPY